VSEEFLVPAYENLNKLEHKDYLRRAINYVLPLPEENRSIESSYIVLFAALETLVQHFRRSKNLKGILPESEWHIFYKGLNEWLNNHPLASQCPLQESGISISTEGAQSGRRFGLCHALVVQESEEAAPVLAELKALAAPGRRARRLPPRGDRSLHSVRP
jgi:hypothetical protein